MTEIKFIKKTTTIGNSTFALIPKAIASMLEKDKEYCFIIKEVENGETTGSL